CLIDSASSRRESSSKFLLGCSLFGSIILIFTSFSPVDTTSSVFSFAGVLFLAERLSGIRLSSPFPRPFPNPLLFAVILLLLYDSLHLPIAYHSLLRLTLDHTD